MTNRLTKVALGAAGGVAVVCVAPMVVGAAVGVSATGPVAGGLFAGLQGAGVAAGSSMAFGQSVIMGGVSFAAKCAAGCAGAAFGSKL